MRRRLRRLAEDGTKISLEDHFGEVHSGRVIMEVVQRFKGSDNHYYFKREGDGALIRLIGRGTSRAVATPKGLALKLRYHRPVLDYREELQEKFRFEKLVIKKLQY